MESKQDIFRIINVSPNLIQIEVLDFSKFKDETKDFAIGSYLKISDDSKAGIIAIVESFKIKEVNSKDGETETRMPTFVLDAQPIGFVDECGKFRRGGQKLAIPPSDVEIADVSVIQSIYAQVSSDREFIFSTLSQNTSIKVSVDGDKFFSKHIAVVGSTGSGKSGTVAKILQEAMKRSSEQTQRKVLNNTHIILFDLHGEYKKAFPDCKYISIENLVLPYWLMNAEELEELLIESNESNSHNQVSQFKKSVILNKKRHNPNVKGANYDTPVFFSLDEILNYIRNLNDLTVYRKETDLYFASLKTNCKYDVEKLWETIEFEESTGSGKHETLGVKVSKFGGFNGDFDRFVVRLETKLNDERLNFLLKPRKLDGEEYKTEDLDFIMRQFTGYIEERCTNITVIDLSGIPFEVLSVVVSLISRLIFDFCFYYKTIKSNSEEVPFLLVLEEAHNYIPQSQSSRYSSVKKSVERIAKEGRKYGISLMIVSQRPSEISETIFSQCNNFVAMRLTNPTDQGYVKRLLPDNIQAITDNLPILEKREALLIGDSLPMPSIVKIMDLEEHKPDSQDIGFRTEWKKDWVKVVFGSLLKKLSRG